MKIDCAVDGVAGAARRGLLSTPQQVDDLFVFNLGKVLVKLTDRIKIVRCVEAYKPVRQRP